MPNIVNYFAVVLLLAAMVEGFTAYLFGSWLTGRYKEALKWIALTMSIALSLAYRIDLLKELFNFTSPVMFVGEILSGFLISRGAQFLNDIFGAAARMAARPPIAGPTVTTTTVTPASTTTTTAPIAPVVPLEPPTGPTPESWRP